MRIIPRGSLLDDLNGEVINFNLKQDNLSNSGIVKGKRDS
jgi:hypothetical protein